MYTTTGSVILNVSMRISRREFAGVYLAAEVSCLSRKVEGCALTFFPDLNDTACICA